MDPAILGIDRLALNDSGEDLKGFYIGKVVDDGRDDSMGRVKCRIEALFGTHKDGIKDEDLPWIQMMPSTGCFIRPDKNDFVTVIFQGSIYEGYYVGHQISKKALDNLKADLGKEFVLDFHGSYIQGKYTGESFKLNINGVDFLEYNGRTMKIRGNNVIPDPSGRGSCAAIPFDTITGLPARGHTMFMDGSL